MSRYNVIKTATDAYIKRNGRRAITGPILNSVLNAIIDSLGKFYQFVGVATPSTNPGSPDQNVAYVAATAGTYANMGGVVLASGEMAVIKWDGTWVKETILILPEGSESNVFIATYGETPLADITAAYNAGKIVIVNNGQQTFFPALMDGDAEEYYFFAFDEVGDYYYFFINDNAGWSRIQNESLVKWSSIIQSWPDRLTNWQIPTAKLVYDSIAERYILPQDGIPAEDLSSDVQDSLSKANTALQSDELADHSVVFDDPQSLTDAQKTQARTNIDAAGNEQVNQLEAKVTDFHIVGHNCDNLFDPSTFVDKSFINAAGIISASTSYMRTWQIPIVAGKTYKMKNDSWGDVEMRAMCFFDANGSVVPVDVQQVSSFTAPSNAVKVDISIYRGFVPEQNPSRIGLFENSVASWEAFFVSYTSYEGNKTDNSLVNKNDVNALLAPFDASVEKTKNLANVATTNLIDPSTMVLNEFVNAAGIASSSTTYDHTAKIPVESGKTYILKNTSWGSVSFRALCFWDANDNIVANSIQNQNTFTAPMGASKVVVNIDKSAYGGPGTVGLFESTETEYVPFFKEYTTYTGNKNEDAIANVSDVKQYVGEVVRPGKLQITKNGNTLIVSVGGDSIECVLEKNSGNEYNGNPVFNFYKWNYNGKTQYCTDDVAPVHAYGTTIGANHGQPCQIATITSHGLDNTDIGTGWMKDGITFYVMRIVDENRVVFLSENRASEPFPSFVALTAGTLTKGAETLTVSSVSGTNLWPALKNHNLSLVLDGKEKITQDGNYICDSFDVVENYDIMSPASTLQKIIAMAGESGNPVYDGDAGIHIENVYHFTKTLSVVVVANIVPVRQFLFANVMFAQAQMIGTNGSVKYYIPNSLPVGGGAYDMRKPLTMTFGNSVPDIFITEEQMADPDNNPVNRVLQYDGTVGFALGYLKDRGVGASLLDYTTRVAEIRFDTGKVYPHGVNSAVVGNSLSPGQIYTGVLYRSFFVPESSGNRLSMYHFDLDGIEYVFIDYKGTMLDKVVVDDSLNGRKVEVLESVNTELKTDVYNGGFYVNATYVEGETCYLVAKIN